MNKQYKFHRLILFYYILSSYSMTYKYENIFVFIKITLKFLNSFK
jgi:hypothetical protein